MALKDQVLDILIRDIEDGIEGGDIAMSIGLGAKATQEEADEINRHAQDFIDFLKFKNVNQQKPELPRLSDLMDFAKAWASLGPAIQEQVERALDNPEYEANFNAIKQAHECLSRFHPDMHSGLGEWLLVHGIEDGLTS